jgi:hypothetical protein
MIKSFTVFKSRIPILKINYINLIDKFIALFKITIDEKKSNYSRTFPLTYLLYSLYAIYKINNYTTDITLLEPKQTRFEQINKIFTNKINVSSDFILQFNSIDITLTNFTKIKAQALIDDAGYSHSTYVGKSGNTEYNVPSSKSGQYSVSTTATGTGTYFDVSQSLSGYENVYLPTPSRKDYPSGYENVSVFSTLRRQPPTSRKDLYMEVKPRSQYVNTYWRNQKNDFYIKSFNNDQTYTIQQYPINSISKSTDISNPHTSYNIHEGRLIQMIGKWNKIPLDSGYMESPSGESLYAEFDKYGNLVSVNN